MKRLTYILFATILGINFINGQVWPDYDETIVLSVISPTSGGGGFNLSISGNTIQISGSGGFNSTILNLGLVTPIGTSFEIPDTVLGYFKDGSGQDTPYLVEIEDNWLKITMESYQEVSYIQINETVTLPPFDQDYNPTIIVPDLDENFVLSIKSRTQYPISLYLQTNNPDEYMLKNNVVASISYLDGLGRNVQDIEIAYTPNEKDMIIHHDYDELSRKSHDYLPLPSVQNDGSFANPTQVESDINTYYSTNFSDDFTGVLNPFSEKMFDGSPLSRTIKQGAPGSDWKVNIVGVDDHAIKYNYAHNTFNLSNNTADNVRRFSVSHSGPNNEQTSLEPNGYYKAKELYKLITKDENWSSTQSFPNDNTVHEFKNKKGQVVLKRTFNENDPFDTYYVYDKYNNLAYVIPPKAADVIVNDVEGNASGIAWQANYSWVELVKVDSKFADEYNKKLEEYEDKDVRDADIENEYGGQGGFALIAYRDGTFSVDIDFTVLKELEFKQGVIASFDKKFKIKDMQIGTYSGNDFDYKFFIKNNDFIIEGNGKVTGLNQEYFTTNNNTIEEIDEEVVDGLCYIYHYDYRNRLVEKKIPGKGWEHIVYNKIDQPILTQDKLLRENNKWLFTKYDVWGRVVYTGEFTHTPPTSAENSGRLDLQNTINSVTDPITYETKLSYGTTLIDNQNIEYSNDSFPTQNLTLFTVNFYDNYSFDYPVELDVTDSFGQTLASSTKTLSTGTKVRVLGTDNWITTIIRYDTKGRIILGSNENEYLNSRDIVKNKLDFVGNIIKAESTHYKDSNVPIVTKDYYEYDHRNRLISLTQEINNQGRELITLNNYDELGQFENKKVGGSVATIIENSNGLQQIDYDYNVRGWLSSINDGLVNNGDLFGFSINYNTKTEATTTELFNGNISETHWITANDNIARKYCYSYDGLNRLANAEYYGGTITFPSNVIGETVKNEKFHLRNVSYDKNGNILTMERYGVRQGHNIGSSTNFTTDIVDGMSYNYISNSNTLKNITDFADNNVQNGIELDNGKFLEKYQGEKYNYDLNGNLIQDLNKNILSIEYNHLNLPVKINFSDSGPFGNNEINYHYDAYGTKMKKEVINRENFYIAITTTEYASGYIYQRQPYSHNCNNPNGGPCPQPELELKMVSHPEGYSEPTYDQNNNLSSFDYIYQYKDHLGNIRLSYSDLNNSNDVDTSEILEENNYYPFGSIHGWYNNVMMNNTVAGKYKYNGKELNDEMGLNWFDYGWRNYDPSIGRFFNIDPHSDRYYKHSPYAYAFNSPIIALDPDGRDGIVTGSGTEDDPYVISANYYYYGLNQDQIDGFNAAINAYNNDGDAYKIKDGNGNDVYVRYNLAAIEADDEDSAREMASHDVVMIDNGPEDSDTILRYGNTVTDGPAGGDGDLGDSNDRHINLDSNSVANAHNSPNPQSTLTDIYKGVSIHEIGHNTGGAHNDPGSIMTSVTITYNPVNLNNNTEKTTYRLPSVNKKSIQAIMGRAIQSNAVTIDNNAGYGQTNSSYLSNRQNRRINEGTVGRLVFVPEN